MTILEQRVNTFAELWGGFVSPQAGGWAVEKGELLAIIDHEDGLDRIYDGYERGVSGKDVLEIANLWGCAGLMVVA